MGKGRPKKLRLSPMQREILWTLQEAGEEDLTTMLNTLGIEFRDVTENELLTTAEDAIRGLMRQELVSLARDTETPGVHSISLSAEETQQVFPIDRVLCWDHEAKYWKWNENTAGLNRVSLVMTEKGEEAARR